MRIACAFLLLALTACSSATAPKPDDDFLWLEEIDGARAMEWVNGQNARSRRELGSTPEFEVMQAQALAALNSTSRIPSLEWHGRYLYNLWKSEEHPRGLYRRTTIDELRKPNPQWTNVLDIDAMSARDNKRWVFKSLNCLGKEQRRCLVSLSPGGGDAVVVREFDAETRQFIDGFQLPEAKSNVDWIDQNTIFVGTDFGPGTLSESGYPRIVKIWTRGTPLSAARTVFETPRSSMSAYGMRVETESGAIDLIDESPTFWTSKFQRLTDLADPKLVDLPPTAVLAGGFRGRLVLGLQEDWKNFKAGSVILAGETNELLVASTEREIVETTAVKVTERAILVPILDNVRGRLDRFTPEATGWKRERITLPDNGALEIMTADDDSGAALVSFETFITAPKLYLVPPAATTPIAIASQEPTFDGSRFEVTKHWAVSKDGTRIPYFVVAPKGMKRDGGNPAHIFSYGGFRSTLKPSYSGSYEPHYGAYGKLWLERGGVFVLANIRGGGEFGPRWHTSVLKENRHKVVEDFEAVAEELVKSGVTSPKHLGIEGRSNGGLLTLSTMTRRPELYGAIIAGAPLADMRRYHELLAGASWMDEYGRNHYSPYHELKREAAYPPLFVYASTRDDRVHPGHARRTVAKLLQQGHRVWYFENIEGGHGGSSTNEQTAYRIALSYAHLWRWLK